MSLSFSPTISPISPLSPISKIKVTPYSTTVTTTNLGIVSPQIQSIQPIQPFQQIQQIEQIGQNIMIQGIVPLYKLEVDTGLNDNPFAQKQMLDFIMAKVYNKWIYSKDMCYLLKYLKVIDKKVHYLSSIDEFKDNKICDDSEEDVELKIDFIEQNILTKTDLKKLLKRMIDELGYKWYEFPQKLDVIEDVVERHIKKHLKNNIGAIQ